MFSVLLLPFLIAMFLAINMGASGTAPSFSAPYGADLIRKNIIPGLFGIFVLAGALIAGDEVVKTISRGVIPDSMLNMTLTTIILLAISLSLLFANLFKVPQSTSQSTIFALMGAAAYFHALKPDKVFLEIIPTWFILPVISFLLSYSIGRFVYRPLRDKGIIQFSEISTHPLLRFIVIASSCYVAFAIGSNNVANASGPITSRMLIELGIPQSGENFLLCMILGTLIVGPCFGIGSSLWGGRVMETTGKDIIDIGPLGATLISVITASLLLLASVSRGIPTSLVQLNAAAIIGIGISKYGTRNILSQTSVKKLFSIWIIAPVIAFVLAVGLSFAAEMMGIL